MFNMLEKYLSKLQIYFQSKLWTEFKNFAFASRMPTAVLPCTDFLLARQRAGMKFDRFPPERSGSPFFPNFEHPEHVSLWLPRHCLSICRAFFLDFSPPLSQPQIVETVHLSEFSPFSTLCRKLDFKFIDRKRFLAASDNAHTSFCHSCRPAKPESSKEFRMIGNASGIYGASSAMIESWAELWP